MQALDVAIVTVGVAYALVLIKYTNAFRALVRSWNPSDTVSEPTVSVIIAARNEADNIVACVESILSNEYPQSLVEVVVVDDGSEDATRELVAGFAATTPRVRLLNTDAGDKQGGKRRAIETGMAATTGSIVLLTDADCRVPRSWIRTMVSAFGENTTLVAGPVTYAGATDMLDRILALELLGLVAVGAGAISLGRPNMCNGANLALRRVTFESVDGYSGTDKLTSGDDELLMHKIAKSYPGTVASCPDPAALVKTQPPDGIGHVLQQRRRWASKAFHYREKRITALAVLVWVFNLSLLIGFAAIPFGLQGYGLLAAIIVKLGADAWLLWSACHHFGSTYLLSDFIPGQLFDIPYVVVVGIAGAAGRYRWKGRAVRR